MRYRLKLAIVIIILAIGNIFSLYPFSLNLKDSSPDNPDDVLLNSYIMQWEYEHILSFDFKNYFNTSYYYPYKNTLAFTEHHTIDQIFFLPLYTILKDPVLSHNIIIIVVLILSGLMFFIYAYYLTNSFGASIIGSVFFTFVPYRYTHLVHLNVLHWWIIPLVFLAFHKFTRDINLKNASILGLSLLFLPLWSNNMSAFFVVPFSIYAIYTLFESKSTLNKRFYVYLFAVIILVAILSYPFILHYIKLREEMFFERFMFDIRYYSPQLKNLLGVHESNILWGKLLGKYGKWECFLFPGAGFLTLFFLSIATIHLNKYRRYLLLFFTLSILTFLFSLGPYFNGLEGEIRGPYYLLWKYLPGFYGIRVPTRFIIFTYFFMAICSTLFVANYEERIKNKSIAKWIFLIIALLITSFYIYEGSHKITIRQPANHPERDPIYAKLKELPYGVLFEFPAFAAYKDAAHVFASIYHRKPTVNGYSGWNSKPLENLKDAVNNYHPKFLIKMLRDMNIKYFILRGYISTTTYERVSNLTSYDTGVKKVIQNGKDILFEIDNSSLKEFDFYQTDISNAIFYLPSCVKSRVTINGGILLKDTENFYFSYRRRYPISLDFVNRDNKNRIILPADVVAYRVYEIGNIHLIIKIKSNLPEGNYTVYYKNKIIKDHFKVSADCSDELSENVEIGNLNVSKNITPFEPIKIEFSLKNKEKYLKAAVDIDDFTTDGVFRVGIFINGIDQENKDIKYEQRYPIYSDMSESDEIYFSQLIPLFFKEGKYKLRIDCVSEKRFWFSQKGRCVIEKELIVNSE